MTCVVCLYVIILTNCLYFRENHIILLIKQQYNYIIWSTYTKSEIFNICIITLKQIILMKFVFFFFMRHNKSKILLIDFSCIQNTNVYLLNLLLWLFKKINTANKNTFDRDHSIVFESTMITKQFTDSLTNKKCVSFERILLMDYGVVMNFF